MHVTAYTVPQIPQRSDLAQPGLRELCAHELLAVGGGLPKGGWAASQPEISLSSVEPLPKGGWQTA